MVAQASPTICVPAGIVIVFDTTYTPASKKMILQPEYCPQQGIVSLFPIHEMRTARTLLSTAWMAAVSSVCPSPFAPCDFTLMNWSGA